MGARAMASNNEIMDLLRDVSGKLDSVVDRVGKLETAVAVDVAVSAQTRDKIDARIASIQQKLDEDVLPQTNDFKRMKLIGVGLVGLLAIGGFTIFGVVIWAGETAVNAVRAWLRIP